MHPAAAPPAWQARQPEKPLSARTRLYLLQQAAADPAARHVPLQRFHAVKEPEHDDLVAAAAA